MRQLRIFILSIGTGATLASAALASEIGYASKLKLAWDVHETISLLAAQCAKAAVKPERCTVDARSILDSVRQNEDKSRTAPEADRFFPLASRWSDDPLRMLHGNVSTALFGIEMMSKCKASIAKGPGIDERGMLCASHYGPMQFAHAQDDMFSAQNGKTPPTLAESRAKMLEWARFAFRAAVNSTFAETPLCTALQDPAFAHIRASLARPSVCDDKPPYTVASFFSGHCRGFSFRNCADLSKRYGHNYVRNAAPGAILHLIQDSYSQSHAARLPATAEAPEAQAVFPTLSACYRIASFYDYNDQKGEKSETHANADRAPLIDDSCMASGREADDVITASARAIWLVQRAWQPSANIGALEEELVRDLETRVLTLRGTP